MRAFVSSSLILLLVALGQGSVKVTFADAAFLRNRALNYFGLLLLKSKKEETRKKSERPKKVSERGYPPPMTKNEIEDLELFFLESY